MSRDLTFICSVTHITYFFLASKKQVATWPCFHLKRMFLPHKQRSMQTGWSSAYRDGDVCRWEECTHVECSQKLNRGTINNLNVLCFMRKWSILTSPYSMLISFLLKKKKKYWHNWTIVCYAKLQNFNGLFWLRFIVKIHLPTSKHTRNKIKHES